MAEAKTKPTKQTVKDFIARIPDAQTRADCSTIAKLMEEADKARAKGDLGVARGKYLAIIAADPRNAQARDALQQLKAAAASSNNKQQSAGVEADVMLVKAISEFYNGQL